MRFPMTATFDVRFSKEFGMAGLDWKFILWVENVFDKQNVVALGASPSSTGRPDTEQNIGGIVLEGKDYDRNPYYYDYGRQIRFGVEVNI